MTAGDRPGTGPRRHLEAVVLLRYPNISSIDDDVDALVLQDRLDGVRDVVVFARCQPRPFLDDGHPGAEATVHLGELERDVAPADDDEMFGHGVEFEDRDVGEEVDILEAGNLGHHRTATDVEENPLGLQDLIADAQRVRVLESGMPPNDGAAVHSVQPVFDALAVVQHDLVFARLDFRHVHAHRSGPDTKVGAATGQVRGVCAGHQCLGRDASVVDTGAADELALHHGNGVAGCGQPACERGPGLTGAHYDRVETPCHRAAVTAASANAPSTATASSSKAIGRSWPCDATRRVRAW